MKSKSSGVSPNASEKRSPVLAMSRISQSQLGEDRADWPDPETVLELVDVLDHQRRVGSSLAAKKADVVVNISFVRRNSAFSARSFLSPSN